MHSSSLFVCRMNPLTPVTCRCAPILYQLIALRSYAMLELLPAILRGRPPRIFPLQCRLNLLHLRLQTLYRLPLCRCTVPGHNANWLYACVQLLAQMAEDLTILAAGAQEAYQPCTALRERLQALGISVTQNRGVPVLDPALRHLLNVCAFLDDLFVLAQSRPNPCRIDYW